MKLTKTLMCAIALGAMAFVSNQAQAGVVIENNLYIPINIKTTFSYVASVGVIKQATFTSKQILAYEDYAKGVLLAVGPNNHVYAITKTEVLDDLTTEEYFVYAPVEKIETDSDVKTYKETDAGTVTFDFYSNAEPGTLDDNEYVFQGTGVYTSNETESADNSHHYYNKTGKFHATICGLGYDFDVSDSALPAIIELSGNGSGMLLD